MFSVGNGVAQATSTFGGVIFISDPTHVGTSTGVFISGSNGVGAIILGDNDGLGCSVITTLDGVVYSQTVTCPIMRAE